jgi:ABC-type transport system involved in multi-copper enzyme maturation permease subunit
VKSLNAMERQAARVLETPGADPVKAAAAAANMTRQAYDQLVVFLAGTDGAAVAKSLTASMILPALLWGSLAFLPFLVVLTSFDMISSDLQTRSLCYSVLRAPRITILLGKLLAQVALFIGLSVLSSFTLLAVAASLIDHFEIVAALPGLFHVWLVLLPYGFCYLGLSAFCSASLRQPSVALVAAFGGMVLLRVVGFLSFVPEQHALAPLRYLRWLSPAQYQAGLWQADLAGPALSMIAYLCFGATFVALASRVLDRRDL